MAERTVKTAKITKLSIRNADCSLNGRTNMVTRSAIIPITNGVTTLHEGKVYSQYPIENVLNTPLSLDVSKAMEAVCRACYLTQSSRAITIDIDKECERCYPNDPIRNARIKLHQGFVGLQSSQFLLEGGKRTVSPIEYGMAEVVKGEPYKITLTEGFYNLMKRSGKVLDFSFLVRCRKFITEKHIYAHGIIKALSTLPEGATMQIKTLLQKYLNRGTDSSRHDKQVTQRPFVAQLAELIEHKTDIGVETIVCRIVNGKRCKVEDVRKMDGWSYDEFLNAYISLRNV